MTVFSAEQLQALQLFSAIKLDYCVQLLDRHLEASYGAEQVFVMEQDWGETVFLLCSGMAKVRTYTADGDEVVMSVLGAGDVFGEMAVLDAAPRSADVVALTPVRLLKLRAAPFVALLGKEVGFALALAQLEASRLRDLNQRFAIQTSDATTRLLNALAYLARKSSVADDSKGEIPSLAQKELGLMAGLSRETASRILSKLRSRGVLEEVDGCLRLLDLQPLIKRGLLPPGS
ncbi:MAG: Crp/Fnr family transcriptional regulator [Prochlorococcus sp.]|jgi:CRP-like cAMP-binding protein|nr:Crp/Fnr family transcriptional regulator [Prochlorococcaceae cyanobacterium ETNP18_MAG_14]HJM81116.1 Crp/Fnr family transcriptional regulator [Prochlorococcaceae cyanobacterium Fu_MAG_72]|tara:strand:+ start:7294 stop:7989 length:696 start_codon:yes stop_codon:yes gene_type:complete